MSTSKTFKHSSPRRRRFHEIQNLSGLRVSFDFVSNKGLKPISLSRKALYPNAGSDFIDLFQGWSRTDSEFQPPFRSRRRDCGTEGRRAIVSHPPAVGL